MKSFVKDAVIGTGFGKHAAAPAYRSLGFDVEVVSPRDGDAVKRVLASDADLISVPPVCNSADEIRVDRRRSRGRRPSHVARVRAWCEHIPRDWRQSQTGVGDEEFVASRSPGSPNCTAPDTRYRTGPANGRGLRTRGAARKMSVPEQIVLYQELAAHDAPRLVLAFVGIHHAASTLLAAGTDEQRRRHLPAILDGEIWVQGFSEPEAGSDLASLRTSARRDGDSYVVNGQKLWASGGMHADWCLLLARTDPDAPKRKGISYFLLDMTTPGVEVRPIRNAIGDSHFCEIFLNDVSIPAANLVGAENAGWQVAQATLGAERGLTMLELAERLGNAGFRWLVQASPSRRPDRGRPAGAVRNRDHRAARVVPEGGGGQRGRDGRPRRRVDRQAVLQRASAAAHRLRRRDRRARRPNRTGQTDVERVGVRLVGAGLHRLVGVDDPRRVE